MKTENIASSAGSTPHGNSWMLPAHLYGPTSNLIIACAGAGILSFPFAMLSCGIVLGILFSLALMGVNMYSNRIVVRMSAPITKADPFFERALARAKTLQKAVKVVIDPSGESIRVISFIDMCHVRLGEGYGLIARATLFIGTLGALIAFLIIIAGLICPVLQHYGPEDSFFTGRVFVIIFFVLFVAFPLSTLPDLESLQISSIIAVVTVLFLAFVVIVESFEHDFFGRLSSVHASPTSGVSWLDALPIIVFAFMCNVQLVPVMGEMVWVAEGQKTIQDMYRCVSTSLSICGAMYILVGIFGFVQFGSDTDGVILDDYNPDDVLANLGRLAMVLHIALAYPVILYPAQQNVLNKFVMPLYTAYCNRNLPKESPDKTMTHRFSATGVNMSPVVSSSLHSADVECPSVGGEERSGDVDTPLDSVGAGTGLAPGESDGPVVTLVGPPVIPLPIRLGTAFTIGFVTALVAILEPEATVVFGLCGSLVGSTLVLLLPSLMAMQYEFEGDDWPATAHRWGVYGLFILGLFVAAEGTTVYTISIAAM